MKSSRLDSSTQTHRAFRRRALVSSTILALVSGPALYAGSATWNVNANGAWGNSTLWNPASSPGVISGTTSTDTATFDNTTLTGTRTITVDANRNIGNITFNTPANSNGYNLNSGSLILTSGGTVLASGAGNATATLNTGLTLQGSYTFTSNANLQVASNITTAASLGSVTLNVGGNWAGGTSLSSGIISQASGTTLSVDKTGTGTWQFNGNNTFSGGVTIRQGIGGYGLSGGFGTGAVTLGDTTGSNNASISFGSNAVMPNALTVQAGSSGTLVLERGGGFGPSTISGPITLANNVNISQNRANTQLFTISGNITGTGNVSVKALQGTGNTTLSGASINFTGLLTNDSISASPTVISGVIGGNVTGVTQNSPVSLLTISGANTNYAGTTTINQGNITVSGNGTLGNGSAPLAVNNTNTGAGRGNVLTLSTTLDTSVSSLSGTISAPSSGTNTATISAANGRTFTVNQTTNGTFAGVIAGAGSFTLGSSSNRTLTLTGNNTYTGATTLNGGTLELSGNGSINASSGITVNGGLFKNNSSVAITKPFSFTSGTIGGTNLSGISVTIGTGQKLSPGNSPGLLTTGDQTWNAGGSFDFEINDATGVQDTNWDRTLVVGTLTLGTISNATPFTINLISLNGLVPGSTANFDESLTQSWVFASATSIAGTAFAADQFIVNTASFQNAFSGSFGVTKSGNELLLTYTAIPEPAACGVLAALATLGLAARRRRRSQQKVAA